jgi:hypothetical protein
MLLWMIASAIAFAGTPRQCVSIEQAAKMLNKDVCISAHIYDVVRLSDGTRFLDVCPPATADAACRFTVVSLPQDYDTVGRLQQYRDANVRIRGIVQPMRGRAGILLSHARQFHGGPPRFRPNPLLADGFSADQARPPINDPNLRRQGGRRAFMNSREQETLPGK